MLFIISAVVFIVSLTIAIITYYRNEFSASHIVPLCISVVSGGAVVCMLIILAATYIGVDAEKAVNDERYESLKYQYEHEFYENDNDVGKKELVGEIQKWNEDLAKHKIMQRNLWVGIFVPNIYDEYQFIRLEAQDEQQP